MKNHACFPNDESGKKHIVLDSWVNINMIMIKKQGLYENTCQHDEQTVPSCIDAKVPCEKQYSACIAAT